MKVAQVYVYYKVSFNGQCYYGSKQEVVEYKEFFDAQMYIIKLENQLKSENLKFEPLIFNLEKA